MSAFRTVALQVAGTVAAFLIIQKYLATQQAAASPASSRPERNTASRQADLPPGRWREVDTSNGLPWELRRSAGRTITA